MDSSKWLSQFLFCYLRQTPPHPDGRPLYAYKCRDKKYEELRELVRSAIAPALRNRPEPRFDALFCLYAAETWRRNHAGGVWTWDTVFESVGHRVPENQAIVRSWVSTGLDFWGRKILQNQQGDRRYLITIACEGGLPLKLLQRENDNLKRYFRQLLDEYHRQRHTAHFDMDTLARQTAVLHLPKSLRHEIVYHLSGELIEAVVDLQAKVPGADDPIEALNKQDGKWRNTLPLSLEDETVKTLLGGLMRQAKNLACMEQQRLRWRRRLIQQGQGWTLENRLELPAGVSGASLLAWTKQAQLPNRLRLLLQTEAGKETVARLTRRQGEGETARYRLEELRKNGVRLTGPAAAQAQSLWFSDDTQEIELPVSGAAELSELPWVFVERDGEKQWLAEGAARTKETQAWVLAIANASFSVIEGTCEAKGEMPPFQRVLYEVQGKVSFILPTGETCLVQCAAEADSEEEWLLGGKSLSLALNPRPVILGKPTVEIVKPDGKRGKAENHLLEWRVADAPNAAWSKDFTACAGEVWIRALDPASQGVRLRQKAEVLPDRAQIEIVRLGVNAEAGLLCLSGLGNAGISIPEQPGCRFELDNKDWKQEIRCFAEAGLPITQFPLELRWTDGRKLTLILPFPRQGAAFVRGGAILDRSQTVPLGRLDAITAVAQKPAGGKGFLLWAEIKSDEVSGLHKKLWLRQALKPDGNGRALFELHRWRDRLDSLLAMTRNLDAKACLEIQSSQGGGTIAKLEVARFDLEFELEREQNRLLIPAGRLGCLDEGWQDRVTVKMIPLWNPSAEPVVLAREEGVSFAAWRIPDDLPAGPWWILGCDGDWARFRPLRWMAHGEGETHGEDGSLEQAVCSPDETRPERMCELVNTLAEDPAHPDWVRVFEYVKLAQTYPASALDLLVELARNPKAMALALIRSTEDQFDMVWSLAHQLPFSWHLLPVRSWQSAALDYFNWLGEALGGVDADDSMRFGFFDGFRQQAVSRQAFLKSLCDWLEGILFRDRPVNANTELAQAKQNPDALHGWVRVFEQCLQSRHEVEERLPKGEAVMAYVGKPGFPAPFSFSSLSDNPHARPLRCAPFVAAQVSLHGQSQPCQHSSPGPWLSNHNGLRTQAGPEDLLFELRQLRDFDRDWFDQSFAVALCLGLAQLSDAGNP